MRYLIGLILVVTLWKLSSYFGAPETEAPRAATAPVLVPQPVAASAAVSQSAPLQAPPSFDEVESNPEAGADPVLRARRDAEEQEIRELTAQTEQAALSRGN